jgi:hypothetical protein
MESVVGNFEGKFDFRKYLEISVAWIGKCEQLIHSVVSRNVNKPIYYFYSRKCVRIIDWWIWFVFDAGIRFMSWSLDISHENHGMEVVW